VASKILAVPSKSTHFRFSDAFKKDVDWLGEHYGGLDRTNTLRVIVAEAKARKLEEIRLAKKTVRRERDVGKLRET
jgi:hypothetical protein